MVIPGYLVIRFFAGLVLLCDVQINIWLFQSFYRNILKCSKFSCGTEDTCKERFLTSNGTDYLERNCLKSEISYKRKHPNKCHKDRILIAMFITIKLQIGGIHIHRKKVNKFLVNKFLILPPVSVCQTFASFP